MCVVIIEEENITAIGVADEKTRCGWVDVIGFEFWAGRVDLFSISHHLSDAIPKRRSPH